MQRGHTLSRRKFLVTAFAGGIVGLSIPKVSSAQIKPPSKISSGHGPVHVVVFSNFEGWLQDPGPAIQWFEACSKAHPSIIWTHMYSPRYLVVKTPEMIRAGAGFTPFLREAQANGTAEVGLHTHLFYDMVRQLGISPRAFPFAGDTTAGCNYRRTIEEDSNQGYDVLITGYTPAECSKILDASVEAFLHHGFRRPTSFCAGYSAASPALQRMVANKGFTVSFAAQVIHPNQYGSCWDHLLDWSGNITPLTMPYRVATDTVLPPPHASKQYLDLVEVPLNMGVDAADLYLANQKVRRIDMFDRHFNWARDTGGTTAVAIGVHADAVGLESWSSGPISRVIEDFLDHIAQRSRESGATIKFATVSDVAQIFRRNKTVGHV